MPAAIVALQTPVVSASRYARERESSGAGECRAGETLVPRLAEETTGV